MLNNNNKELNALSFCDKIYLKFIFKNKNLFKYT
jgi:hypothetical protein